MLNRLADGKGVDEDFAKRFQIKRAGKDKDDIFWTIGKIHGIENICYATDEELDETGGDPMLL